MRRLSDIRSTFLDFFKTNGHEPVPSSSLVPNNDPTLLFTNAGMVQFKDVFTGAEKRPYTRATTSQKCVRAGGKHNDLENVGYTARHHTFFEMLGNFSFGDYFKEEAIHYAWTLITKDFGLSPEKLVVTVYHEDEEAAQLWKKIAGFSDHKIIRIATADNFWSMGDVGPCGPCTEIFYDHGESIWGGPPGSANEDGDRFVEFWNLVFMQFEQKGDGTRIPLPKPSVDTGMGLERFSSIMQGVHNNYDTDLFQTLIQVSTDLTQASDKKSRQSHNVIADHLRASAFLLADGVLPSNEGRGYVLRRIMRRGMRHAHLLGAKEPLMHRLVSTLVELMSPAFPELLRSQALITENLKLEEERFRETLDRGLRLLEDEMSKVSSGKMLSGDVAFKLYDTYGFPLDLTQDVLRGQGYQVDDQGFKTAMDRQKQTARAAWAGTGDAKNEQIWYDIHDAQGATEFLGYEALEAEGILHSIVHQKSLLPSVKKESLTGSESVYFVSNQTPFYGESGGQEGDRGWIVCSTGKAKVLNTLKMVGSLHVHVVEIEEGAFSAGDKIKLQVDPVRRRLLRAHHSATHLLHAALRRQLGDHVTQKGSLVSQDRLRFDFTHLKALSSEELDKIEAAVNAQIMGNKPVETHLMSADEAMNKGAMALFGEKYGAQVRVLTMGEGPENKPYSMELCGGTHVRQTGDIGFFKILSEVGISAGVRRIEAIVADVAYEYVRDLQHQMTDLMQNLKCSPADGGEKLQALLSERKTLERQVGELRQKLALAGSSSSQAGSSSKAVGAYQVVSRHLEGIPARDLKPLADQLKAEVGSGIVILTSIIEGKVALVVGVTADLTAKVSAVDLTRCGVTILGGAGGGGRPDMAQGGGNDPARISDAVKAMEESLI